MLLPTFEMHHMAASRNVRADPPAAVNQQRPRLWQRFLQDGLVVLVTQHSRSLDECRQNNCRLLSGLAMLLLTNYARVTIQQWQDVSINFVEFD